MSSKRLDSTGDYLRHGYKLRIDCLGCKRVVVMDPLKLLEQCRQRAWPHQIASIERRLKCSGCGAKTVRVGPAFGT